MNFINQLINFIRKKKNKVYDFYDMGYGNCKADFYEIIFNI